MSHERADLLVSLVIDGTASDAQWNELSELARVDPMIWRDVAESQRHQQVLSKTLNEAVAVAEQIPAPTDHFDPRRQREEVLSQRINAGAWTGWAVAAVVAVAAFANQFTGTTTTTPTNNAGPFQFGSPDEALDEYVRLGQEDGSVVGPLPSKYIVSQRENPDGEGYELICLQQIVTRQIVPELYEYTGQDENGQLILQQFKLPPPSGF